MDKVSIRESGKESITKVRNLHTNAEYSYVEIELITGRTHQIRSHLAYIGHPAIGDPTYAPRRPNYGLAGQALHSKELTFVHPSTGETIHVETELPAYYQELIAKLHSESI